MQRCKVRRTRKKGISDESSFAHSEVHFSFEKEGEGKVDAIH